MQITNSRYQNQAEKFKYSESVLTQDGISERNYIYGNKKKYCLLLRMKRGIFIKNKKIKI